MKGTDTYVPPAVHHSHIYVLEMTSEERIAIINALQLGLSVQASRHDVVAPPKHARELLKILGVAPCA